MEVKVKKCKIKKKLFKINTIYMNIKLFYEF